MVLEITRLLIGLTIAMFHRPIADFVLDQESSLVVLFRQRGLAIPALPKRDTVRNLYFVVGIGIALFELVQIWSILR